MKNKINRRDILKGTTALALGTVFASRVLAEAPPAEAITPQLIEAAKKEGKVVWYTSIDLSVSEKIGAAFKAKFGIEVRAERTGAERVFQRIGQEYASNVHAVDVANSSDAAHLLAWKRQGILLPYVPRTSRNTTSRRTATPTAPMPASAQRSRRSPIIPSS